MVSLVLHLPIVSWYTHPVDLVGNSVGHKEGSPCSYHVPTLLGLGNLGTYSALSLLTDLGNPNPFISCQLPRLEGIHGRASLGSSLRFWSGLFAPKSYIFLRPSKAQASSYTCHQPTMNSGALALVSYQSRHPLNFEWQLALWVPHIKRGS